MTRSPAALAAAALAVGAALSSAPSAFGAPEACAASSIARTVGSVGTNTGIYLEANPETNETLTVIAAQPAGPQSLAALTLYFDRNPAAAEDLQAIQQPLTTLSAKCKLPISMPQVLGLLQAAQQNGTAGATAPTVPAAPAPTAAVPVGTGNGLR
ncbi:MAG: hemophore [Mycobacterium sp.]